MKKIKEFFKSSYGELKKVVWPTRESVGANTKLVLISTLILAAFFGIIDFLLMKGLYLIF